MVSKLSSEALDILRVIKLLQIDGVPIHNPPYKSMRRYKKQFPKATLDEVVEYYQQSQTVYEPIRSSTLDQFDPAPGYLIHAEYLPSTMDGCDRLARVQFGYALERTLTLLRVSKLIDRSTIQEIHCPEYMRRDGLVIEIHRENPPKWMTAKIFIGNSIEYPDFWRCDCSAEPWQWAYSITGAGLESLNKADQQLGGGTGKAKSAKPNANIPTGNQPNYHKRFADSENELFKLLDGGGISQREIADKLKTTESSISNRKKHLEEKLRTMGIYRNWFAGPKPRGSRSIDSNGTQQLHYNIIDGRSDTK